MRSRRSVEIKLMASDVILDSSSLTNSQHETTNGTMAHDPNRSRKERQEQWWHHKNLKKKRLKLEYPGEIKSVESMSLGEEGRGETNQEHETQRTKLRNRETITKPDSLKYEPDFNKGFHTKLMQNLYNSPTKKKNKKTSSEPFTKSARRKSGQPLAQDAESTQSATKTPEVGEVFDSYKFSMNLINGDVDVSKNAGGKDSKHKYVLFIGNLPYDITREQLEEHFRKTGGIKSIRIPREKGTEKGRGFAYMEFDGRISHGIALRLHHTTLRGRKINVEFTSIGGGKSEARKEKLQLKNKKRRKMKVS